MQLLSCNSITVDFDGHLALDKVSFDLEKGHNLVIFGPNGAGKTVLVQILSGNLVPTSGEIQVLGKSLQTKDSFEAKKKIGFVSPKLFQDYDFESKVTEIIMSGLFGSIGICNDPTKHNNKVVKSYINRVIKEKYGGSDRVLELLEKLHISYLKDEIFGHLSYGEKARVLLARALIIEPELLILDEPTTGLDLKMRAEFAGILVKLCRATSIVYVTHYLEEISEDFGQILFLKEGQIFDHGAKEDLLTDNKLSSLLETDIYVVQKNGRYLGMFK